MLVSPDLEVICGSVLCAGACRTSQGSPTPDCSENDGSSQGRLQSVNEVAGYRGELDGVCMYEVVEMMAMLEAAAA